MTNANALALFVDKVGMIMGRYYPFPDCDLVFIIAAFDAGLTEERTAAIMNTEAQFIVGGA